MSSKIARAEATYRSALRRYRKAQLAEADLWLAYTDSGRYYPEFRQNRDYVDADKILRDARLQLTRAYERLCDVANFPALR